MRKVFALSACLLASNTALAAQGIESNIEAVFNQFRSEVFASTASSDSTTAADFKINTSLTIQAERTNLSGSGNLCTPLFEGRVVENASANNAYYCKNSVLTYSPFLEGKFESQTPRCGAGIISAFFPMDWATLQDSAKRPISDRSFNRNFAPTLVNRDGSGTKMLRDGRNPVYTYPLQVLIKEHMFDEEFDDYSGARRIRFWINDLTMADLEMVCNTSTAKFELTGVYVKNTSTPISVFNAYANPNNMIIHLSDAAYAR
ncbi:hypothetical protein ACMXYX_18045 (plasmid) [Neptuniibacter sp. QD72_48]|uniref:hypothetical protein n=1 Tax=Neptuniibacter sp. QD72_48 TaxID=3398214 RepID=UPI0039F5E7B0